MQSTTWIWRRHRFLELLNGRADQDTEPFSCSGDGPTCFYEVLAAINQRVDASA
jgi:hypothetical protein